MYNSTARVPTELVVPAAIDFPVRFEPSKVARKKYVLNGNTEDYIDVVGHTFTCASHGDFARGVFGEITNELSPDDLAGMKVRWLGLHGFVTAGRQVHGGESAA